MNGPKKKIARPVISLDVVRSLLAHVHAFTTLALEAQATAISRETDGVINYVAIFSQVMYTDCRFVKPGKVNCSIFVTFQE